MWPSKLYNPWGTEFCEELQRLSLAKYLSLTTALNWNDLPDSCVSPVLGMHSMTLSESFQCEYMSLNRALSSLSDRNTLLRIIRGCKSLWTSNDSEGSQEDGSETSYNVLFCSCVVFTAIFLDFSTPTSQCDDEASGSFGNTHWRIKG